MFHGFNSAGMGKPVPGQWYVGLIEFEGKTEIGPVQAKEDDIFASDMTVVLLEPVPEAMQIPMIIKAPYLSMGRGGNWLAWWFEPELNEEGDWIALDVPEDTPDEHIVIDLELLSHFVKLDLSQLPTLADIEYTASLRTNPWYGQQ